jgi:DNA-directed RNA polymerase specialized sigma24 family protein
MGHSEASMSGGEASFQTTHWSLVLAAVQSDSPAAAQALAKLCRIYWYPVYAFIRRRGFDPDQAKDYTQELFASLIEKRSLKVADRQRGRFRSFLLACAQHFLSHEQARERALKRGGEFAFISLDEAGAENRYAAEPADPMTPEKLFDRRWAVTLLDRALDQLRAEYAAEGKAEQFEALQVFLSGAKSGSSSYAEAGARFQWSYAATRQAVHRLRRRFGELLRAQVAETVASSAEFEEELQHLKIVLSE